MSRDFDSPWKEVWDLLLQEGCTFFVPTLAADIDWTHLDAELQQVIRDAVEGERIVDEDRPGNDFSISRTVRRSVGDERFRMRRWRSGSDSPTETGM